MNNSLSVVITLADALQALTEALEALTDSVPPYRKVAFEAKIRRARQARVEAMAWVDEQR